jgi:heme-degrading monooxygenase HmoA
VITRVWRGWARPADADRYERHYREAVASELRQVAGFRGARLLRRDLGEETEFVSMAMFDGLDAVRAFAGPDAEAAVVADEARAWLTRYEERVRHYEVAAEVEAGA